MQKDCEKSSLPKFPVPPLYILLLMSFYVPFTPADASSAGH